MKTKKRKYIYAGSIIVIIALIAFFGLRNKKQTIQYSTAEAKLGSLIQTVSETGTVKSKNELKLNFLTAGKIAAVNVKIGDKVKKDAILAQLDSSNLLIKENEAAASVSIAQANLSKLIAGATKEDINVSEKNVEQALNAYNSALADQANTLKTVQENTSQAQIKLNDLLNNGPSDVTSQEQAIIVAETNLANAEKTYQSALENSEDSALNAILDKLSVANTALDNINRILTDEDGKTYISVSDPRYAMQAKSDYYDSLSLLSLSQNSYQAAVKDKTRISAALNDIKIALNKTSSSLNNTYKALENSISSSNYPQSEIDANKTTISAQITLTSTGNSAITSAEQSLNTAQLAYNTNVSSAEASLSQAKANYEDAVNTARNSLSLAQINGQTQITAASAKVSAAQKALELARAQLEKIKAGASSYDISLSQSQLKQAESALGSIRKQIDDMNLRSPIDGVITAVNYEVGEQVGQTNPMIVMLGENNLEIEVDISEADINKITIKDPVEITLDAFGEEKKFKGEVFFIEPAETKIQDVIYYKVKISLDNETLQNQEDSAKMIKPGMTANTIISTANKENVLIVPMRAVLDKDNMQIVRVLNSDNTITEKKVETGLSGDGGQIEIISGLQPGEMVVTSIKENK